MSCCFRRQDSALSKVAPMSIPSLPDTFTDITKPQPPLTSLDTLLHMEQIAGAGPVMSPRRPSVSGSLQMLPRPDGTVPQPSMVARRPSAHEDLSRPAMAGRRPSVDDLTSDLQPLPKNRRTTSNRVMSSLSSSHRVEDTVSSCSESHRQVSCVLPSNPL
jgi:hypothetical protein